MPCGCRLCAEHMGSKSGTKAHDGNAGIAGIAYFPPQVDPGSVFAQALNFRSVSKRWFVPGPVGFATFLGGHTQADKVHGGAGGSGVGQE